MKKSIFIALLIVPFLGKAQISLEKDYKQTAYFKSIDTSEYYYVVMKDKSVELYNESHSLVKTITPSLSSDEKLTTVNIAISRTVFDADDSDIEIAVVIQNTTSLTYVMKVIEEDGSVLFTSGINSDIIYISNFWDTGIFKTSSGYKLKAQFYNSSSSTSETRIFSLPGTYHLKVVSKKAPMEDAILFPNPSSSSMTISAKNKNIQSVNIYDMNGKIIDRKNVNGSQIEIETSMFLNGNYICEIIYEYGELETKRFVVNN